MKTITRIFAMLAVMSAVIFMDACKGEKGDVGPAGTTGPTGAVGAVGAIGPVGATGTANVQYSDWVPFTLTGTLSSNGSTNIVLPKITQEVLDKYLIFSYLKFNSANWVYSLPLSFPSGGGKDETVAIRYYLGNAMITSNVTYSNTSFRYLLVPGGVPTGRKAAVDYNDYNAVKKYYNLPD
jgi:hypothetical protein